MIFSSFFPDTDAPSAYAADYRDLWNRGYRGLIFDIDNTLVPHDAPATAASAMLMKRLKGMGFKCMIVSNNEKPRVSSFADAVGCGYVYKASKPGRRGYLKAAKLMGLPVNRVAVIGDQFFTDIWGANRSRMASVLVGIISPKEPPHIILKRVLELPIRLAWSIEKRRREG
ncbi:MAG: YqeG family HAD IIIA-type phosphatase [Lachnospiraceae bacterium]|nr:YqeG family HAD IIIA-type phosphatase [Lachnospiraceae bacterium]